MNGAVQKAAAYLERQIPGLISFGIRVAVCILVYIAGKRLIDWIIRVVRRMLKRTRIQAGAVTFTLSMTKIALYTMLVLGIAMQFGLQESSVAAVVASAGVAIGLALQGGLSNFAGGFLILLFQPFQVGDYVITQGEEGTVKKIEILYTTLQTGDNRRVIVPNGNLANNIMVNVTAAEKRRLEIRVGISYEDSIQKAKQVLERLVLEEQEILEEEDRRVVVAELGESAVIMAIQCWVKTENYLPVLWRMNEKIKETFDMEGIHIPYPQMDVRFRQ